MLVREKRQTGVCAVKIVADEDNRMKIASVHLNHPGTPEPAHLKGEQLEAWKSTAKAVTLCWRFFRHKVKTTDDIKQVTCHRCLAIAKINKLR